LVTCPLPFLLDRRPRRRLRNIQTAAFAMHGQVADARRAGTDAPGTTLNDDDHLTRTRVLPSPVDLDLGAAGQDNKDDIALRIHVTARRPSQRGPLEDRRVQILRRDSPNRPTAPRLVHHRQRRTVSAVSAARGSESLSP
jgi:hypothetical protein